MIPVEVIIGWVDGSIDRARLVAGIAAVGGAKPTPKAQYLLSNFGDDDQIRSSLYGDFISGSFMGPQSNRLAEQIGQLQNWRLDPNQSAGAKRFAAEIIEHLERSRAEVLEREAEQNW